MASIEARFWAKVDKRPGGCWVWTAFLTRGYGYILVGGRQAVAHRYSWEMANGPIPEGMQIDHLCRNRACVNPAHLEPVTQQENIARGLRGGGKRRVATDRVVCTNGHPTTPGLLTTKCKVCRRGVRRRYYLSSGR